MSILVTGGAGYIGAHVVRALQRSGEKVVIVDLTDVLSPALGEAAVIRADLAAPGAEELLRSVIDDRRVNAVVHLAARKEVEESVRRPDFYDAQNVGGMSVVLSAMRSTAVRRLVFSSSAAVYGQVETPLVDEHAPCRPLNPYGKTKLRCEQLVEEASLAWGLAGVSLRLFNAAGAGGPDLGDRGTANLVPIVMTAAASGRSPTIFGDDYDTPDGTAVRDYVHVEDLADAHLAALALLEGRAAAHVAVNIGTGRGHSVLEIMTAVSRVVGRPLDPVVGPRRQGDPARVVANVARASSVLGWSATRSLDDIVSSAWGGRRHLTT